MHVSILGASNFGVTTLKQLIANGHEAVLIDKNRERLEELSEDLDCGFIHGDGTLPSILRDAFGDGSDAFVALTNEDEVNILASLVAMSIGYERVIPQIVRSELLSITEELGLTETITPHESVAQSIVSALEHHSQIETASVLHNELRLLTLTLPETMAETTFEEFGLPSDVRAVAHIRDGSEALIDPTTRLEPGDRVMLVFETEKEDLLRQIINPEKPVK